MSVVLKKLIVTPLVSSARSAGVSQASASFDCSLYGIATAFLDITAAGGAPSSYSLALKLQGTPDSIGTSDASARWFDVDNGAFTAQTGTGKTVLKSIDTNGYQRIRVVYTLSFVGGNAPTLTFRVDLGLDQLSSSTSTLNATISSAGLATAANQVAALPAGENHIGQVASNIFGVMDTLIRPANVTAYTALQSINCDLTVTAGSYTGTAVTLTSNGHGLVAGDRITVVGINTGFTWANVDGNWVITSSDTNTFTFSVTNQPTGSTPASASVTHSVSKLMKFNIGRTNTGLVSIRRVTVNIPGLGTGALRLWLYNAQVPTLVDQSTFTTLAAYNSSRMGYIDLYPITEGSGSNTVTAVWSGELVMLCETAGTNVYARLEKVGSDSSVASSSAATVTVKIVGYQM